MNSKIIIQELKALVKKEQLGYITSEMYMYILFAHLENEYGGYNKPLEYLGGYISQTTKSGFGTTVVAPEIVSIEKLGNASILDAVEIIANQEKDSYARRLARKALSTEQIVQDIKELETSSGDKSKPSPSEKNGLLECLNDKEAKVPLIGRDKEIERTIEILSRMMKNNVLHVGPPGVGKTSIVHELAHRIERKDVPEQLIGYKVYSLRVSDILAGTAYRGAIEEKLKSTFESLPEKSIVYIDEIHTMVGAGKTSEGGMDLSNMMKTYLTEDKIKFIGATTSDEYKRYFEKDAALQRRFQKVQIDEPSISDSIKILMGIKPSLEKFHNVTYTDEAIASAVELSAYHVHDRYLPDKAIDLIDEAGAVGKLNANTVIATKDIEQVLCKTCNIPPKQLEQERSNGLIKLEDNLSASVFGQETAVKSVSKKVKFAKSGLKLDDGPLAKFLFVGPTGCGKTELAKTLSKELDMKLLRYDMSEYSEEHTVAKLFGSPAGYVGYDDGGLLTNAVRDNPNSVILFDEIEKAHPKIYNALLGIMDYGIMTDNKGKKADFRNTVIIFTSNAGAKEAKKSGLGFGKATTYIDTSSMKKAVEGTFSPEFLGRLSDVVEFNGISSETATLIAKKEMKAVKTALAAKNVELKVSDKVLSQIADIGCTPENGAREIKNLIRDKISDLFVDELIGGKLANGGTVRLKHSDAKGFYILCE